MDYKLLVQEVAENNGAFESYELLPIGLGALAVNTFLKVSFIKRKPWVTSPDENKESTLLFAVSQLSNPPYQENTTLTILK